MKHILFTLKGCAADDLDDEGFIRDVLYQASIWCKSTLLSLKSHKFEPQGVTAVALLAESHISIHTCQRMAQQFVTSLLVEITLDQRMV